MTHHRLNPWLPALLLAVLTAAPSLAAARPGADEQVESLHKEITSLRVVQGLALQEDQIQALIPMVEEGIGLVDDLRSMHDENQKASVPVLRVVRDDLRDEGEVGEATEQALQDHAEACEARVKPVVEELRMLAEEVMVELDEDQRAQVKEALGRTPYDKRAERRARRDGGDPPRDLELPPDARGELHKHNLRKLFGLVFSEEFLSALQQA